MGRLTPSPMSTVNALGPNPLIAGPSDAAATKAAGSQEMGKEEFLRLLVTQLSNQDPLNPMEGQEFAAQLAQFTSVEQLVNIGKSLDVQGEMQGLLAQGINSGVAAGLIGKEVVGGTDTFTLGEAGDVPLGFTLGGAATNVTVTVRNAAGEVVRTIEEGSFAGGEHTVSWNGTGDDGERLGEGLYTFEVTATDANEASVEASPLVRGRVDRVSFGADGIRLWLGGSSMPLSTVRSVS